MGFAEERRMAEEAMDHPSFESKWSLEDPWLAPEKAPKEETDEPPYPPVARRFKEAREALGLTMEEVASRWGEQVSMYWDLEFHDDEAFTVVSVQDLFELAEILKTTPMILLFGEEPPATLPSTTYLELIERLRAKMTAEGLTVKELSDRVGWELEELLEDPRKLAELPIYGLRWVCREAGVDWVSALAKSDRLG